MNFKLKWLVVQEQMMRKPWPVDCRWKEVRELTGTGCDACVDDLAGICPFVNRELRPENSSIQTSPAHPPSDQTIMNPDDESRLK